MLLRAGVDEYLSSRDQGWRSLHASAQREQPYEHHCPSVPDHLLVLHLDGPVPVERELPMGRGVSLIPEGGTHIIPGGTGFGVRLRGPLNSLHLYLADEVLRGVAAECGARDPSRLEVIPRFGDVDPALTHLLLAVRDVLAEGEGGNALLVDHLAAAIAARLVLRHSSAPAAPPPARKATARDIAPAVDFMQANLQRPITLADIAAVAACGPVQLTRRFRQALGKPPHQYLIQLRVEAARRLLAGTRLPIAEVALECGFASQEHLTRLFRRSTGTTPAAFRRHSR
ncbi:AraC family transcriptional regulator [Roseomonas nepalensis]|uniref:AraC family transcriptional regulator n=2 Tax=Muricoccus nepalensis TaxID=1854500 RepID=A0A502GAB5_9PROT|nr:AraC family transcriptional regulator [Roseomonas nepalensis]